MYLVPEGRCKQVLIIMPNVSIFGSDDARVLIPGDLERIEVMVPIDKVFMRCPRDGISACWDGTELAATTPSTTFI